MWIPQSAAEVEAAVAGGAFEEGPSFDAKAQLPTAKRNLDLAIDVAAMTTEGGVLLYGVDEDEHGRPTVLAPIKLAGTRERVAQIVETSIAEVPAIDPRALPLDDDPARGYLVVVVPRSARAPHQVIVGKEFRYYGRGATGNRILTQGEVALLYGRRARWEVDRDALLDKIIAAAPFAQHERLVYSHGVTAPVAGPADLVRDAAGGEDVPALLRDILEAAVSGLALGRPDLVDLCEATAVRRLGADGWVLDDGVRESPEDAALIQVDRRGVISFFCGRAGDTLEDGPRVTFETVIAGNTAVTLAFAGELYKRAGFIGEVDVGVATTNLRGAVSFYVHHARLWRGPGFGADSYRRTTRLAARELATSSRQVTTDLYAEMFEITLPAGFDPFDPQHT